MESSLPLGGGFHRKGQFKRWRGGGGVVSGGGRGLFAISRCQKKYFVCSDFAPGFCFLTKRYGPMIRFLSLVSSACSHHARFSTHFMFPFSSKLVFFRTGSLVSLGGEILFRVGDDKSEVGKDKNY